MLKRLLLAGVVVWLIAFTTNETNLSRAQGQAGAKSQMSEAAFKNIQVLKGIPVDEFMGTMGLFSAALNVCCGDCHTGAGTSNPKWEDDPPRKRMARQMAQMVKTINQTNFGGRQVVTCWTCHRGSSSPAVTPPLDSIYGEPAVATPDILPAAPPATSGTPPADQILDKFVQALGGAEQVAKLTSYTAKATGQLYGEVKADPAEIYAKAPNQLASTIHQREGDQTRTYDGKDAWVMLPLTVVGKYPLTGSLLEGGKLDAEMAFPGRIKSFFPSWRVSYPATIDGRDVYVLQGTGIQNFVATFYFDKQTGLLTRMVRYCNSAVGRVPTQIDYSDYRTVAGVKMPFKWTYGWVSNREEWTLSEVQPNVTIDTAKFAEPVQRKP